MRGILSISMVLAFLASASVAGLWMADSAVSSPAAAKVVREDVPVSKSPPRFAAWSEGMPARQIQSRVEARPAPEAVVAKVAQPVAYVPPALSSYPAQQAVAVPAQTFVPQAQVVAAAAPVSVVETAAISKRSRSSESRSNGGARKSSVSSQRRTASVPVSMKIAVNPRIAGNSLSVNGQRVSVESATKSPGETDVEVSVTPEAASVSNTKQNSSKPVVRAASNNVPAKWGFSREQELFRTKWGWDAYDQAQRAAAGL